MVSPTQYRPHNRPLKWKLNDTGEKLDWADNPVSNSFAWVADHLLTDLCKTEGHWSMRVADYFATSCHCCMFGRGLVIGALVPLVVILVAYGIGGLFA